MRAGGRSRGIFGARSVGSPAVRRPLLVLLAAIGIVQLARVSAGPDPLDLLGLALVAVALLVAVRERRRSSGSEAGHRSEAESFARILSGLARSVSPDAIVNAIVEEVGAGTGADHVAVVRRRRDLRNLEAVLASTRPGAAAARTTLSLRELDDPAEEDGLAEAAIAASRGRRLLAVPIEPDPDGDPQLVPLGIGRASGREEAAVAGRAGAVGADDPAGLGIALVARARRPVHAAPMLEGAGQRIADRIADRLRDAYGLRNLLAAPLRVDGRVEGAIVISRRTGTEWSAGAHRILEAAAVEASAALARVYSLREAEARATTDALTGLPNRRYFDEYLHLLARRRRAEDRVGVLMIDIDRFKRLNDTFGHAVGDHVLREVALAIAGAVREDDVPSRFGGEEFAVLLKNPSPEVALEVGERVRRAVAGLDLRRLGVPGVSVSVGVAVAERPDDSLDDVIDQADRALYRAKRGGRDRVVAA